MSREESLEDNLLKPDIVDNLGPEEILIGDEKTHTHRAVSSSTVSKHNDSALLLGHVGHHKMEPASYYSTPCSRSSQSLQFCDNTLWRILKLTAAVTFIVVAIAVATVCVVIKINPSAPSTGPVAEELVMQIPPDVVEKANGKRSWISDKIEQSNPVRRSPSSDPLEVIRSSQDLKRFGPHRKMIVQRLTDREVDCSVVPASAARVDALEVVGRATEPWLQCLLEKLVNVANLTLDVDDLCKAATVPQRIELPALHLPQITRLDIKRATMCPGYMAEWILRWQMPTLKVLCIKNTEIYEDTLAHLESFVERTSRLREIHMENVFLCDECKLSPTLNDKIT